jgi:hypothetical protein
VKPAAVRFYFDADVLGLGKLLSGLRPDITYRGDPGAVVHKQQRAPCPIQPSDDADWIPLVAAQNWLIVTRDSGIQQRRAEIAAVRDSGARMVALAGEDATTLWSQLELVMSKWARIEELLPLPGPFIYRLTRKSGLSPMPLELPGPRQHGKRSSGRSRQRPIERTEGQLDY